MLDQPLIVNGQAMTIVGVAPRGFDGTTLGSKPQVFVPITMRGLMQPSFKAFRQPPQLLGVPVRPAEARDVAGAGTCALNAQYHAIINKSKRRSRRG